MLYKDWLADWLTNYVKPSAKDKTYGRYSDIINHHLLPNLGVYELNDLTPIVVQRFITELTQNGNYAEYYVDTDWIENYVAETMSIPAE